MNNYTLPPGSIVGTDTVNLQCHNCGRLTVHRIERGGDGVTFYRCTLCKQLKT